MKKFGAYLSLIGILSQASALAWVGGPYSNNTYDGLDGGVFGGTIRGANLSGIFKFSQGGEAYVSPFGDSIVYHKGMTYYGECYGFVDFDAKTVSGVTNGLNGGITNDRNPNNSTLFTSLYGTGFGVSNGASTGTGVQNGAGGTIPANSGTSTVAAANSSWNGRITKSKQTVRFSATGKMTMFGNATEVTTFINVSSSGDFQDPRFSEDAGLPIIGTGNPPGTGTTTTTIGAQNNYPNIQNEVKIKVYGSRTSVSPYFPGGSYVPG